MKTFRTYITEAANYEEMFNIFKDSPRELKRSLFEIKWAKTNLLKQDRITWFLKVVRLKYMTPEQRELEISNLAKKDSNWNNQYTKDIISSEANFEKFRNELSGYLKSEIAEISNLVLKDQSPFKLMNELKTYADNFKNKADKVIFDDDESKFETIVEFPNGWRWINLNRPWCGKEGGSLGHCGNYPEMKPTDRLLSLRSPVKIGDKTGWKPHITAVLHKDDILGQMIGRAMTKPKKDLHPYIVELLINRKHPIRALGSETIGAQDASRNFRLTDLSEIDYNKVIELNPGLKE